MDPKNVLSTPLIDPNYLHDYYDVICIKNAIKLVQEALNTSKFQNMGVKIHWPKVKECSNFGPFLRDFQTNEPSERYLDCVIRSAALTAHHPGGNKFFWSTMSV